MMRNLAVCGLTMAVAAMAFLAGRVSAPSHQLTGPTPAQPSLPSASVPRPERSGAARRRDPRTDLLRALQLPDGERHRATQRAMRAWLAEEGAAALREARDDPKLAEVVDAMTRVALVVDPDIFSQDPSLLAGVAEAYGPARTDADAIAALSRNLTQATLLDLQSGAGALGAHPISRFDQPITAADAYAEVESILAEPSPMRRMPRLLRLVSRMAASDPVGAAALVDGLPTSEREPAIDALIAQWAQSDPLATAHWLGNQGALAARHRFAHLAQLWGMADFHSANAFAATLSGTQRRGFLEGLASAVQHLPNPDRLAWVADFEGRPDHSGLALIVAQGIVQDDLGAALSLIESMPPAARMNGYANLLPMMAMRDPDAAMAAIETIRDPSQREQLIAMVAPIWAQIDPDRAINQTLDLAPGPTRDQALGSIALGLAHLDSQRAIEAIGQIEDPEIRNAPLQALLGHLEDENEALRLGREHGIDREAVLEARASSPAGLSGSFMPMPLMMAPSGAVVDLGPGSSTAVFAAPPMVMLDDGRRGAGAADGQSNGNP